MVSGRHSALTCRSARVTMRGGSWRPSRSARAGVIISMPKRRAWATPPGEVGAGQPVAKAKVVLDGA